MKPVKTLDDVSDLLRNQAVKNIVVVAGAGISTPSGIPDFRYYNTLLIHTSTHTHTQTLMHVNIRTHNTK